jgi:hypothetical protein
VINIFIIYHSHKGIYNQISETHLFSNVRNVAATMCVKLLPRTRHQGPKSEKHSSTPSSASVLDGGGWITPCPGRFTDGKVTGYPWYRRMGRPQGQSGRVRKISFTPEFDPRTIQPVTSRYTDYAILDHHCVFSFRVLFASTLEWLLGIIIQYYDICRFVLCLSRFVFFVIST